MTMTAYSGIFCLVIAIILVAVKLILEHQRDQDRRIGIEQEASSYTMRGMLRLMREERRNRKEEKREKERLAREKNCSDHVYTQTISVKRFDDK